jgi:hypothetical protein
MHFLENAVENNEILTGISVVQFFYRRRAFAYHRGERLDKNVYASLIFL